MPFRREAGSARDRGGASGRDQGSRAAAIIGAYVRSNGGLPMRTTLLIAAAGLIGLAVLPSGAQAQPWGGYYRPGPPPFWHGPRPFLPPPPLLRPRVYFAPPPPVLYQPPPVYYAPPPYPPAYVPPPPVAYRSRAVHRPVRRRVQPAASVPCTCAAPSNAQPASVAAPAEPAVPAQSLPALRAAPQNNVYPPERTQ